MLIEFSVKNFRSIKDEQTLSMAKANGSELDASNTFTPDGPTNLPLLCSAAIYGPNAAGKSNLIKAMMVMADFVRNSASEAQQGDYISVVPFLFDKKTSLEPTEFEIVFISEGVRYQYGFTATSERVQDEWLIAFPKGRPQKWFTRKTKKGNRSEFYFGDHLSGQKSVWREATRKNALFLSTAVQLNSEQLNVVFRWFRHTFRPVLSVDGWGTSVTASMCDDKAAKNKVLDFLKAADFNIHDVSIKRDDFDPDSLPDHLPSFLKETLAHGMKGGETLEIKTIHKTQSGDLIPIDLDAESDGTKKFFSFVGPWIESLSEGYVLVVDELHANLHPSMVKHLVNLFHDPKINSKKAQLLFTTHETSILNKNVFRRDQVWFCEKQNNQSTTLYPLTDFSPRKDRENIEQGYLSGRYGALPFITPLELN